MSLNPASLFLSFRHFQLIYVALRLGLFGLLDSGPKTLEVLAEATHVPAPRLLRLLRGLLWAEVLASCEQGFRLTESARQLADASAGSAAE